jgi:hypothetical protein
MSPRQIEAWALRIIERVENKQNVEDTLVELKSEWPAEPNKAARQIGGHANAARGEPILWLIGVDEKAGKVVGAGYAEFANWYPSVEKEFNGMAPRCILLNIPHKDGKAVVALLFESDRSPFVVRNAVHGKPNGGPVSFEVPWRNGSRIDSARRADLIKLLTSVTKLPDVEVLAAGLCANEVKQQSQPAYIAWRLEVRLFITPRDDSQVVIPVHRCESSILPSEANGYSLPLSQFRFDTDMPGNITAKSGVTVTTPGLVTVSAYYLQKSYTLPLKSVIVRVVGKARPIGADSSIDWSCELTRCSPEHNSSEQSANVGMWEYGSFTPF